MENNNFEIKSEWANCKYSEKKLFDFLNSVQHLESILPKDKINNIQIKDHHLSFEIENIITLSLYINKSEFSNHPESVSFIEYLSEPFGNYHLCLIAKLQNNQSQIVLTGYLNPFILSIAKKKLTHLVHCINQELSVLELN